MHRIESIPVTLLVIMYIQELITFLHLTQKNRLKECKIGTRDLSDHSGLYLK